MTELTKRALSGIIYVALILAAIIFESMPLFLVVFSFIAFVAHWEYASLVQLHRTRPLRVILDGLAAVFMINSIALYSQWGSYIFALYFIYVLVRTLYSNRADQPNEIAKIVLGHLYITLPLVIATILKSSAMYIILISVVAIWANDTGAYLVGSQIGRRKLFPSLSPKKSWEGFFGGMLFSVLSVVLLTQCLESALLSIEGQVVLGILISVFATWGDLFESMLKRNAGVKDSGSLIPGHGGILDRIDSMLFVIPLAYLYITYIIDTVFF